MGLGDGDVLGDKRLRRQRHERAESIATGVAVDCLGHPIANEVAGLVPGAAEADSEQMIERGIRVVASPEQDGVKKGKDVGRVRASSFLSSF